MNVLSNSLFAKVLTATLLLGLAFNTSAQSNNSAGLDFDPKIDGFSFANYRNVGNWQDDLGADDLIKLFGLKTACKTGTNASNCVLHVAAEKWKNEILEGMNIGHCEGIAVASLRIKTEQAFKKRTFPEQFQPGAKTTFSLSRNQLIENYISYFWVTQTFEEIKRQSDETVKRGPLWIAQTIQASTNEKKDTYLIEMFKYEKNRISDGHAVAPIAVEETADRYKIHVYDNNYPGETRFIYVSKTGNQRWEYSSKSDAKAKPDYIGDSSTPTFRLTATKWRENKCFKSTWRKDLDTEGCGATADLLNRSLFTNASFQTNSFIRTDEDDYETADFFLTGEGEMLVTDGNGKRIGYDPKSDRFYEDIPRSNTDLLIGGFGEDLPHYTVPYEDSDQTYKIVFSGKYLDKKESELDFVYSGPGFTVGFDGILLDQGETLEATISNDGQKITFKASKDGETPEVFYAFDPDEDEVASYSSMIEGVQLTAGKSLTYDFDIENGKLFFTDDDGNEDDYDITLIRVNGDGTKQVYKQEDLDIGKADKYEMDFGDWDGEGEMCFKDDEDDNGFDDEKCTEEPNENTQ